MGYRSEVALALDAKIVPALMTAFAKCEETQKLCTQHVDHLDTDYGGKGNWLMRWDHIKWYDSYKEIAAIEQFMDDCDCEDLDEHYRFVRIGEETDDNEVRGWGFDHVYITRSVEY